MLPALLLAVQTPAFEFDYASGTGLTIATQGVPIVRGSWFQYHEPGFTKSYYSSNWNTQKVTKLDADTIHVEWTDTQVSGDATFHRQGDTLTADYRFAWLDFFPVDVESTAGLVWSPAFDKGTLLAGSKPTRSLDSHSYDQPGIAQRRFSADASTYTLDSTLATVSVTSDRPLAFFDARGYDQSWAQGQSVWWLGTQDLHVTKDAPARMHVVWRIDPKPLAPNRGLSMTPKLTKTASAVLPDESIPPMIPKPKQNAMDFTKPLVLTGKYSYPVGRVRFWSDFTSILARRFRVPEPTATSPAVAVDGGVSKLGMVPGGYRIIITPKSISVLGEEDEGLRNGLRRVAELAYVKSGKLCLPTGQMLDSPAVAWRGVHLFVGPQARPFQRKLWERVLLPLGMNQVVLQCEQTDWKAAGGIGGKITTSREELAALWAMYRELGIEPVPLIQSWGHMGWLFANGKNHELQFNPDVPYAIDPRKPEARAMVTSIWDEAIDLLKPKIAHFGLDEVNLRGYPDDPELVTKSWEEYVPFLGDYAKKKGVDMMIWGDQMLAPDEAPDAGQAPDRAHSARRRAAVPKGTLIGDWHYKSDPRYASFTRVLQLWQDADMRPIASGWYDPNNIFGFAVAAGIKKTGYLHTTWAGYESSEPAMIAAIPQFSAMVLSADYAWSARTEAPDKLGYDPTDVFRRMYFDPPAPLAALPGFQASLGSTPKVVAGVRFMVGAPVAFRTILQPVAATLPDSLSLSVDAPANSVDLALDTAVTANEGDSVATITVTLAGGGSAMRTIRYGQDVRSPDDPANTTVSARDGGLSLVRIPLSGHVRKIEVRVTNPYAGLRLHGVTLE